MKLLISIVLLILALTLTIILAPLGVIVALIRGIYKRKLKDWYNTTANYIFNMAYAVDQFGNVMMAPLFNILFIKKEVIKEHFVDLRFGDPDETISSCLGRNFLMHNLTWVGTTMFVILDKIDPNHCIDAIEDEKVFDLYMSDLFKDAYKKAKSGRI